MAAKKAAEAHDAAIHILLAQRQTLVMNGQGGSAAATAITNAITALGYT